MRYLKQDDGRAGFLLYEAYRDRVDCPRVSAFMMNAATYELAYLMNGEEVMGVAMRKQGAVHIGVLPAWRKRWASRGLVRKIVEWAAETGKVWTRVTAGNEISDRLVRGVGFIERDGKFELDALRHGFETRECDVIGDIVQGVVDVAKDVASSPIGQIAATAVGYTFGGPIGAALMSAGLNLAAGGDPLQAMIKGGLSYFGSSALGGAVGGETLDPTGLTASDTANIMNGGGGATGATVPTSAAGDIAGVNTNAQKFLVASANPNPGTMTDVSPGLLDATKDTQVLAANPDGGAMDMSGARAVPGDASSPVINGPGGASSGGGIINSMMKWGKDNPTAAYGAMQLGGGAIAGIGNNITQNQLMDKKIAGEKALQENKLQNQIALEEWKRRFIQSGSTGAGTVPMSPASGSAALRRPDGSQVFSPNGAIIAGSMNA